MTTALLDSARTPVAPAPELREKVTKSNRAWRRQDAFIASGRAGLKNMQAWLERHRAELAEQEREETDAVEQYFLLDQTGPLPEDGARSLRKDVQRVERVFRLMRDFLQASRERTGMLLQADCLGARADLLEDIVSSRRQKLAAMLLPIAALEGKAEITQSGDSVTELLENFGGELRLAAAELRARVKLLDGLAAGGKPGASDYDSGLLDSFAHRMTSLFNLAEE